MSDAIRFPHTTGCPGGGRDSLEGGGEEVPVSRRLQKAISMGRRLSWVGSWSAWKGAVSSVRYSQISLVSIGKIRTNRPRQSLAVQGYPAQ